jgi:transcriptional regulator with XRE-family HTH domain
MAKTSDIPNLIRILRIRGWDQKTLAAATGIHPAYINQLVTGRRRNPTLATLTRLTEPLGVTIDVLLDQTLTDVDLRTHLSRAALRKASLEGLDEHPRFAAFIGTAEAPVSVQEWQRLGRILAIAGSHPSGKAASPGYRPKVRSPS